MQLLSQKHHGSVAEYRASEGKTITIPYRWVPDLVIRCSYSTVICYRGDVNLTVHDLLGGLRSACTYTGAPHLKELAKRATFIRVNQQANEMYTPFEV